MPTCRICLHEFKSLRFQTEHISVCTRCVNTLSSTPEPAKNAEARLLEKLMRGMQRNAERDLTADMQWKRLKAQQILNNLEAAAAAALHDWITSLLEKPSNSTRDFKIMRAHRRGLLRADGFADYPTNWSQTVWRIRSRDKDTCADCGATTSPLDVHHIIYLSHHGTNQQNNLILLCRKCHETEHGRKFDLLERPSETPQPEPVTTPRPVPASPQTPPPAVDSQIDLFCPHCRTGLVIATNYATQGQKLRCRQCSFVFSYSRNLAPVLSPRIASHSSALQTPPPQPKNGNPSTETKSKLAAPNSEEKTHGDETVPPKQSLKSATKLRVVGVLILFFNLWLISEYNIQGIGVFLLTVGFAVAFELFIVRSFVAGKQ